VCREKPLPPIALEATASVACWHPLDQAAPALIGNESAVAA
jgi:hypothetical protein